MAAPGLACADKRTGNPQLIDNRKWVVKKNHTKYSSGYDGVTVILSDKNGVFKRYTQKNKELEVSSLFDGPGAKPRSNSKVSSPSAHVKVNRIYSLSTKAQCQYDDVVAKYKGTD